MRLYTKKQLIRLVAGRWYQKYGGPGFHVDIGKSDQLKEVYERLLQLGPEATEENVKSAIGNSSWTSLPCGNCKKESERVVVFTTQSELSANLCQDCLEKAIALLKTIEVK